MNVIAFLSVFRNRSAAGLGFIGETELSGTWDLFPTNFSESDRKNFALGYPTNDFLDFPRILLSPEFWLFGRKRNFFNTHSLWELKKSVSRGSFRLRASPVEYLLSEFG